MKTNTKNGKPVVFVVEDSEPYRILLSRVLGMHDFDVYKFGDPEKALQSINIYTPDIIVSDIEMPKMDGFDLYYSIKEIYPSLKIPVVYVSSTNSQKVIDKASDLGAITMLQKTLAVNVIAEAVKNVLENIPLQNNYISKAV